MSEAPPWLVEASISTSYEILSLNGLLLAPECDTLAKIGASPNRLVVVDMSLPGGLVDAISEYFSVWSIRADIVRIAGGESAKAMERVEQLLLEFSRFGLSRRAEPVIVFGGGAVLDLVGFAASIYRRGVPYVRVPTSVLAYVDASVGIKTGVNFGEFKNLVGSFYPPEAVLLDSSLLSSLPAPEVVNGFGEILKLAIICDANLFERLDNFATPNADLVRDVGVGGAVFDAAIDGMLRELENNMYETDLRRAVDFGHTLSPAFELRGSPRLRHGEAVAVDCLVMTIISRNRALLPGEECARALRLAKRIGLCRTIPEVEPELLWASIEERALHRDGLQRIPIPIAIGSCAFVDDVLLSEVRNALGELAVFMC